MITRFKADHIHIATEGPLGWAARRYCVNRKRAFTTAYHTQFPAYISDRIKQSLPFMATWSRKKTDQVLKKFHAPSAGIIVTTDSLKHELIERGYKNPLHCMARGVPTELFHPGEKTEFKSLKKPVALYVGRVAIEKNLEAFLKMNWEGSKVIVGKGPSLKDFKSQYKDAYFVGCKTGQELARFYRSADLFVFPSLTDTFGLVIVEAISSGIPVVAFDAMGPRDILSKPMLGTLAEGDNLTEAAEKALNAPGTAQDRYEYAQRYYSWESIARQFGDILENCEEKGKNDTDRISRIA